LFRQFGGRVNAFKRLFGKERDAGDGDTRYNGPEFGGLCGDAGDPDGELFDPRGRFRHPFSKLAGSRCQTNNQFADRRHVLFLYLYSIPKYHS
jgi:hypothetical protein